MGAMFSSRPLHQDRTGAGGREDWFCQERARAEETKPSVRYREGQAGAGAESATVGRAATPGCAKGSSQDCETAGNSGRLSEPVCPTNGDKDDRLEGVASRGLSTVPTNCKLDLRRSWPSFPLPFPHPPLLTHRLLKHLPG